MPIPSETLSLLRWRARRGLLENDLMLERFFELFHDRIEESDLEPLNTLLDLSDNDLMDLLLLMMYDVIDDCCFRLVMNDDD